MRRPISHFCITSALFVGAIAAQSVLPPFDSTYQVLNLGSPAGVTSYGGTAFLPSDPSVLLLSVYPSNTIRAVPLTRTPSPILSEWSASPLSRLDCPST